MKKGLILALGFALAPLWVVAQNLITGHITDVRTGEPLIGASVIVKSEKSKGVVTDIDGNFKLQTNVEAPLTLRVEYVGYRALDVDVYDFEEPVEIALIDAPNFLNEIVVTALGKEKVIDKIGTTQSVIDADKIVQAGTSTLINALSGKASGLTISSPNGEPGMGSNIIIRGANTFIGDSQPLIILDGTPISNENSGSTSFAQQSHLNDLNPNDIESLQVLKGASAAALWGSRAANGVIVITTKNGPKASKPRVTYSFTKSFDWIATITHCKASGDRVQEVNTTRTQTFRGVIKSPNVRALPTKLTLMVPILLATSQATPTIP